MRDGKLTSRFYKVKDGVNEIYPQTEKVGSGLIKSTDRLSCELKEVFGLR